jgi:hypothetical protein
MYQTRPNRNDSGTGDIKMKTLLVLVKREIYDQFFYFIVAFTLAAILILIYLLPIAMREMETNVSINVTNTINAVVRVTLPIIVFVFSGMGITQIYIDKSRKIPAFLLTLPTSRSFIFTAKIITGILAILTFFLPLTIAAVIMKRILLPPIPIYEGVIFDVSSVLILTTFASYCISLQTSQTTSRFKPLFGIFLFTMLIITLIIIKGL